MENAPRQSFNEVKWNITACQPTAAGDSLETTFVDMSLPRTSRQRGLVLVALGLVLIPLSFGASWALAPDTTVVSSEATAHTGMTLVGVQGPGWGGNVTALDERGTIMWGVKQSPRGEETISYQDVTMLKNGSVLATFADGNYQQCGAHDPPCKRTGYRIIKSRPKPHIVAEWSYPVRTRKDSEVHDAEPLPSGDILIADMEYESIFIIDQTTGERIWTWNASQYYDSPSDPTKIDWLHINDVDRIGAGRYLISVRNTNQLLIIQRGRSVVEVINKNRDPTVLNKQHNPHWLGPGAVLVADSENDRIVELHKNTSTGEWEVAWALSEVGGIYLEWPRDADRLQNGHTLITDSENNRIVEVTRNGSLVASYPVQALPYEADRLPDAESAKIPYKISKHPAPDKTMQRHHLPVLSTLLSAARHVVVLPYWVSEVHVFAVLTAFGLIGWGGVIVVRTR
ncbi:aryl-sulfate sulfotransferase [Haladaptatus halobius]|uniref:aryl-sulfate sulfotransferase n=1 Tax=Haladaptatus halobius TaxID=2884875 RepID=UPI001D0A02A6|nr:aryl-sulfate sulfotransferase [Haladaptatus halobius]